MAFRASCVALLLSSLPIAGCGTVANLARQGLEEEGGVSPFGGVRHDVSCIKQAADSQQHLPMARRLFCAADLPFSFIGDVVTWPYTATYTYINQPIPTPPITLAPAVIQAPPVPQATAQSKPQTSP